MQPKKVSSDAESQLALLNIRHKGLERYESTDVLIEGTPGDPDYRWKITFKSTGRVAGAASLTDALQQIRKAIDPNLSRREAKAPAFGRGLPAQHRKKQKDPNQFGLGIGEGDL